MFESPVQVEKLIHSCSTCAEAALVVAYADIAGCLKAPLEQRGDDLGRKIDQTDASIATALPSVTFFIKGRITDSHLRDACGIQSSADQFSMEIEEFATFKRAHL